MDVLYVIAGIGFFGAAAGYVWFCDRLIGGDVANQVETAKASPS